MTTIEERTAAREAALREQLSEQRRLARPTDYVYDKAQEAFWDLQDGTLHGEKSVDASIPQEFWRVVVEEPPERPEGARGRPPQRRERLVPPSKDIMRVENDQFVEGSTWWPGQPQIIRDWFINADGFYVSPGRRIYNQYRPPPEPKGDAAKAGPWVEHVKRLWPDPQEHDYFFDYCAHMVQRPEEKCNAAIVMSGEQGIGKDSALHPVKMAVGSWNVKGIEPDDLFSTFKPFLQTLMLVVDEVRPSKDEFHASSMYNIMKPLAASPPETLPVNEKHAKLRYVMNVLRLMITTNNWMDMYIPPNDRRMFIMHSALKKGWHLAEDEQYFARLWKWIEGKGSGHVGAWLMARDISAFNAKKEVNKTVGWEAVAGSWKEVEDGVTFALEKLGHPDIVFGAELADPQFDSYDEVINTLKSPRKIAHRMSRAGYVLITCPDADRWQFRAGDELFRSRLAFVKSALAGDQRSAVAAIRERGKAIAAARDARTRDSRGSRVS